MRQKSLLEKLAHKSHLKSAWKKLRHRANSKGLDGQTIEDFERSLNQNLDTIQKGILNGKYKFTPLRGSALPQGEGKDRRPLKIPSVRDRVVQKALELILTPILKEKYPIENPTSFAYIKKRWVKDAAEKVREHYRNGNKWVYEADIEKFFNNVNRTKLLTKFIYPVLPDDTLNKLIEGAINAEIGNEEELERLGYIQYFPPGKDGIPQGGVLSPLFANVFLAPLDKAMIDGGFNMVRYADDFLVMCKTKQEAENAAALATKIVDVQLGLSLYPIVSGPSEKKRSQICQFHNIEFLGLCFQGERISPGKKAITRIIKSAKQIPQEYKSVQLSQALYSIRSRVLTWGATYYYTDVPKVIEQSVNNELKAATLGLLKSFGLKSKAQTFQIQHMTRLGIPSFSDALKRSRIANGLINPVKQDLK